MARDRDYIFGVLAVRTGLTTPRDVMSASSSHLLEGACSLGERLRTDGTMSAQHVEMVEGMVDEAIKAHGGDVHDTLQSLGGDRSVLCSFGGSIQLDKPGKASAAEASSGEGTETTFVTLEQPGRYAPRNGSEEAAEIGRGGLGRVWIAFDEHLGREVALKGLLDDGTGSSSAHRRSAKASATGAIVARFLREARVTGQLEHPNIVPVYEVGQRPDGTYYYVMRVVRGRTLGEAMSGRQSFRERVDLLPHFVDLCNAIAYAHSRSVIHRDIKPANVMIGEFGETVVLDWGLAKVRGKADLGQRDLAKGLELLHQAGAGATLDGSAIGTPAYMSPEQADGAIDDIDESSDVWSLGAVLFELLAGRPPFEGVSPFEIMGKVLKDPPPSVGDVAPGVPRELAAVAMKALERDKTRRYASARELASEINAYLSGRRVEAYQYSSRELLASFIKRNRAASIATAVVLGLIVCSAVVLFGAYRREGAARRQAQASATDARANEQKALVRERQSELHLSMALEEKARNMLAEHRFLETRIYAAASLLHNPANPNGQLFAEEFESSHPASIELRTSALSMLLQATQRSVFRSRLQKEIGIVVAPYARVDWLGADRWALLSDGVIHFGDQAGNPHGKLEAKTRLSGIAVSPDRTWMAIGAEDGTVRVVNASTLKEITTVRGPDDRMRTVAASPNGEWLVAGYDSGPVTAWRTSGWKSGWSAKQGGAVVVAAFSPASDILATGDSSGAVVVRDARSGREMVSWQSGVWVTALAFSPDGRLLAATSGDMEARVWLVREQRLLRGFNVPGQPYALEFSHDGAESYSFFKPAMGALPVLSGTLSQVRMPEARPGMPTGTGQHVRAGVERVGSTTTTSPLQCNLVVHPRSLSRLDPSAKDTPIYGRWGRCHVAGSEPADSPDSDVDCATGRRCLLVGADGGPGRRERIGPALDVR